MIPDRTGMIFEKVAQCGPSSPNDYKTNKTTGNNSYGIIKIQPANNPSVNRLFIKSFF